MSWRRVCLAATIYLPGSGAKSPLNVCRDKLIPFPGEVDLLVGGPPCQGVSGNNRHALTKNILKDARNRQILVFLAMVKWWRPAYVLMENVQDTLKMEDGAYVKYGMGDLIVSGYQTRLALIAAGMFGVAQGRWRVFMWAARFGEQLPAFPEPTHNCRDFNCAVIGRAQCCTVGFAKPEHALTAHPPVLLGDILSDLPEVTNFELGDVAAYAGPPQTIPQAWLRRRPLDFSTPIAERLKFAEAFNVGGRRLNEWYQQVLDTQGEEAVSLLVNQYLNYYELNFNMCAMSPSYTFSPPSTYPHVPTVGKVLDESQEAPGIRHLLQAQAHRRHRGRKLCV
jgi:site-specific DNA-cytosine methylase